MITNIQYHGESYQIDLEKPIDISIPLKADDQQVNCFYAPPLQIEPVRAGNFVGDIQEGGLVNFKTIRINPHGNGTHTECVGHIAKELYTINQCLKQFFFLAEVISIEPCDDGEGDQLILREHLEEKLEGKCPEALIIRTLPNNEDKKSCNYSGKNPPYLYCDATNYLVEQGIKHLLIDLPSVDREQDGGRLLSHKFFWNYPHDHPRTDCTITELIYVPPTVPDGTYYLNLQIISLELDVSPSKPILYQVIK